MNIKDQMMEDIQNKILIEGIKDYLCSSRAILSSFKEPIDAVVFLGMVEDFIAKLEAINEEVGAKLKTPTVSDLPGSS